MININTDTREESVKKLLEDQLANIQTQFDILADRITALSGSTESNFEEVKENLVEISQIIDNVVQTQQTTATSLASLSGLLNELKEEIADEVTTKEIEAILATIDTINATTINSTTVNAENGNFTNLDADNVNAETVKARSFEVDDFEIENLETSSLKTEQAEVQNLVGDSATVTDFTTESIKSKQSYSSQSYGDTDEVDKFKFVLNAGAIIYSDDADDAWAITWNGAIEYSNPNLTIKRIDVMKENDGVVAIVYFYHPNTDLNFSVLNFGNSEVSAHYELVDKTTAYEEENTDYFGIIGETSSATGTSLVPVYVEELPETGSGKYLYITPERLSYIWKDNSYFLPLSDKIEINAKKFTGLIWELQFKAAQIDVSDISNKAFEGSLYSLKPIHKCPILDEIVPNWSKDGLLWVHDGDVEYCEYNPLQYTSVFALPETVESNKEVFSYLEWTYICPASEFEYYVESIKITSATQNTEVLAFNAVDYFNTKINTNIDQLNYEVASLKYKSEIGDAVEEVDVLPTRLKGKVYNILEEEEKDFTTDELVEKGILKKAAISGNVTIFEKGENYQTFYIPLWDGVYNSDDLETHIFPGGYGTDYYGILRQYRALSYNIEFYVNGVLHSGNRNVFKLKKTVGVYSKNVKLATSEDIAGKLDKENGVATNLEVTDTLTVNGDIIQNGEAYETHAEKVYTKNDLVITRDGAVSGLADGEVTGIQATKYDGTNDGQLVFDKNGEARVGDVGDTQPLLTRGEAENLSDGQYFKWDAVNRKAVGVTLADIVESGNTKAVTSNAVKSELNANYFDRNALLWHNIPRKNPKDITSYISDGSLWKRLNGTDGYSLFEDIFTGDYIKMSRPITVQGSYDGTTGSQYVTIAGIDTLQGNGDNIDMMYHHLVMVPGQGFGGTQHFGRRRMNPTNDTTGAYVGSEMFTTHIGPVETSGNVNGNINQQLFAEFGNHLKTTRELLSVSTNPSGTNRFGNSGGCSNNWGWHDCQAVLMSEIECYGSIVWSSSGYDTGTANHWLPLFMHSNSARNNRTAYYWLKDVASSAYFCRTNNLGHSDHSGAGNDGSFVRPRFVIA